MMSTAKTISQGYTYPSNLFAHEFSTRNLFTIRRRCIQRLRQIRNGQFLNASPNTEGFNTIGPKILVTKERVDYSWNSS
jgi:hypothetical protein